MTQAAPDIECEQHFPTLAVGDVQAAVDFYTTKLGFRLGFTWGDPPTFAGVTLGHVEIHLALGTPDPKGCSVSFLVEDADELYEFHRTNDVDIVEPPGDRLYGLRDYRVRDLYGYGLGFGHHLFNLGPPVEIERIDVPVRLEKRLAALLGDLAERKHMSMSSCLEETLLHTLEGVGPHTKSDLEYIEKLKQKHGIDYDSHASYRFHER